MKKILLASLLLFVAVRLLAQTEQRIALSTITPSENTGMDYSPWLNDNLQNTIADVWAANNMKYIDVKIALAQRTNVSRVALYDGTGNFADNPASIYAVVGTQRTLLGTFDGALYQQWVNITVANPVQADSIIVRKYGNNVPQKIQVYGQPISTEQRIALVPPIVPSENTGMDYSPWLNDNLQNTIADVWAANNMKYIDVKIAWLNARMSVVSLSMTARATLPTTQPRSMPSWVRNEHSWVRSTGRCTSSGSISQWPARCRLIVS